MGKTPGKNSRTGRAVQDRFRKEGKLKVDEITGDEIFEASDGNWYPLREADMSHHRDAVRWWNETGRRYGPKSPEVREWMLNPDNYMLDWYRLNRSQGAILGQTERYMPPVVP